MLNNAILIGCPKSAIIADMAGSHSYTITKDNNKAEREAVSYLLASDRRFFVPDSQTRKTILATSGLDIRYSRAFDLLYLKKPRPDDGKLAIDSTDIELYIELKTTKKRLPNNPSGFFFGATQNEFEFARQLGDRFRFCFVSLHPESTSYVMLTLSELEKRIRTKRVQYQINL